MAKQTMHPRYKKKSAIGLGIGLPLVVGGLVTLLSARWVSPRSLAVAGAAFLAGLPFYLWGCCAFAQAKGYSKAIVLTAFFGVLFPVVVLLATARQAQALPRTKLRRSSGGSVRGVKIIPFAITRHSDGWKGQ